MSEVTHSTAHYLMVLSDLLKERGYARSVDVARRLGVSRPAAHLGLKSLKAKGLVEEDERRFYSLPEDTKDLICQIRGNHSVLEVFFAEVLGTDPEIAHENACRMEHLLDEGVARRLLGFLKFTLNHPAGERFREQFRKARTKCPHEGQCELCSAFKKCPLGTLEKIES
jgi:DtxR family Mn-dependent transcriptional regulator